jgi:hypothetical protein
LEVITRGTSAGRQEWDHQLGYWTNPEEAVSRIGIACPSPASLTITHLLEKNLVTTYDAEKILWALLGSVYLYEIEEGKRSKYEIVDMIEAQRQLLLKEFSRMGGVGDG